MFITNISIKKVRHLKDVNIPLCDKKKKHLIITGKNGSGKTSLLEAISIFLNSVTTSENPMKAIHGLQYYQNRLKEIENGSITVSEKEIRETKEYIEFFQEQVKNTAAGIWLSMDCPLEDVRPAFEQGQFVVADYKADRIFSAIVPQHVEKVELKNEYLIQDAPREQFIKYLLDMKMTQALADSSGKHDKADQIKNWFTKFESLLQTLFDDKSVKLDFDEETFKFHIHMDGREPFDFNTLSSGYAAVLDIVVDLIIRMEKHTKRTFDFSIPGIVLIDEIETHLHLELQKKVLEFLTTVFPNIQFIVSTHSPFVLNSLPDVAIYDLEKHILVENGLADVPYDGIVKGYFSADTLSATLRQKYERYKELADKTDLTEDDYEEIADLELYLDEIPDYLALDITTEYQRLKNKMRVR